jgi:hypothetical protein
MRNILLFAVLVFGAVAAAQTCPVTINEVHRGAILHKYTLSTSSVRAKYTNTTDKTIVGMLWHITVYSPVDEPHKIVTRFTDEKELKPGKERKIQWDIDFWQSTYGSKHGAPLLTLAAVMFADGSKWEDDGTGACSMQAEKHS